MDPPANSSRASFSKLTAPTTTLFPALVGSVLCWLAFPPVGFSYLAWIGPVPWLLLVTRDKLPGRRPYLALWLAGMVFWLLTIHWVRLPHPLNYLGWVALAAYLGAYLPVFVALARVGVIRYRLPLVFVAPVVWTGLEWFRAHLLTGFLMGSLAHTQVNHLWVIQIADIGGEYLVTFLILLVAAAIANVFSEPGRPRLAKLLPAAIAIAVTLLYGSFRISALEQIKSRPGLRIALIQGNTLADWKNDAAKQQQIMDEYVRLSREAVRDNPGIDLVIWPETAFRETLINVEPGYTPPPDRVQPERLTAAQNYLKLLTNSLGCAVLVGIDRYDVFPDAEGQFAFRPYNSAVLVRKDGEILGHYDKMHRVVFGEYIPFAKWFPFLYNVTPITGGIEAGQFRHGLRLGKLEMSVNICYETVVPHLIRRQANRSFDSRPADLLVNLTNDAWFWGSSELDMHLACGVFRVVENRVPLVIAANGGLSAQIDSTGRVLQVSPRQQTAILVVDVESTDLLSQSLLPVGWFAGGCVLLCVLVAICDGKIISNEPSRTVAGKETAR